ncbi:hypothetical protein KPH14_004777 [Odynerus spinipes]|uniref:Organic solute transporter alpha-like protein n=1 Tax=Odynerus spinipes TaxID=1348599 RepID=A0AAD9RNM9_9HYME|nr:hypothetical protein KPH14_004777 [Odynerus spinipes]
MEPVVNRYWNVTCDPYYVPSAIENIESFGNFGIALICTGAIFSTLTLYLAIEASCNVFSQKETGTYKANVISILSVYPIASICSLTAIAIPRAQLLSEAVTQVFLTMSLYRLYLMLVDVGRRKVTKAPTLMLKVGPCCCWPCLPFPTLEMIDANLSWIRVIVLQLPIVQGLLYFISLVIAVDEQRTMATYFTWFQPFVVISIFFAMYGITVVSKTLHGALPGAKLNHKTLVSQMVLLFSKAQAFIVKSLIYTGLFPCNPPIAPVVYINVTQNSLMLIEMLLLCIAARYLYYVELDSIEDSTTTTKTTTDRPKDKAVDLTNNNESSRQLSKISVVSAS